MTTLANHQSIVVGIDGTVGALGAARWAAELATHQRVPLVLLSVVPALDYRLTASARAESDLLPQLRTAAERKIEEAAAAVRHDQPELDIRRLVEYGVPARKLIEISASAQLIVMGSTASRLGTLLLGSTALSVSNNAQCPVAVWRHDGDHPRPDRRPLLVGIDGSPDSESAIGHSFELAAALGVGIIAVHAWTEPDLLEWTAVPDTWPMLAAQERELLAERLAGWSEKFPQVEVTRVVQKGATAAVLLEHAADAQLVLTGSHGHNRLVGMLAGSTSQNLLHHAPCPVMICRSPERRG
ncbi:universal stress protein [Nocardia sp. NPDC005998]|uniref:universal stress protein n=1 Tax=Nocardia sp. NPDC005998 TaxID=3156894 RepID=UPI00339FB3E3